MMELPLWSSSHHLQLLPIFLRIIQTFPILHRIFSMALLDVLDVDQHLPYHRGLLGLPYVVTGLVLVAILQVEAFQGLTHVLLDLAVHLTHLICTSLALGIPPGYGDLATICGSGRQGATPALILSITPIFKHILIGQQAVNEISLVLTLPGFLIQTAPLLLAATSPAIDFIPE